MRPKGIVTICVLSAAMATCGCSRLDDQAMLVAMQRYLPGDSGQLASGPRYPQAARPGQGGVAKDDGPWFALGARLQRRLAQAEEAPDKSGGPTPWPQRRGPAYPGDFWHSFGRDAKELPATIWDDTKATFTDPVALIGIGAAGITGIALNAAGSDDRVADHFTKHGSQLNKFWDTVGDVGGNPGTHFAVAGAMYFAALARNDTKTYEASKTLINALAINGLATLALKGIVRTRSPNGDPFGWPSGHTSSSFCFATVMYDQYGPWVGVPLLAFAGYVGYERIDARNHDFSDVVSGAMLGMAIGYAVSRNHQFKVLGMDLLPYGNDRGAVGLALLKRW